MEGFTIKIVTVNIPDSYVDAIKKLVGENGLYPSRSELIRVAVREFLIRELNSAEKLAMYPSEEPKELDPEKYVNVPIDSLDFNGDPIREFKTYKIIRRLEY